MKAKLSLELLNKKEELSNLSLYSDIKDLETSIRELEKQENELRET
jgi:hypothetical protein